MLKSWSKHTDSGIKSTWRFTIGLLAVALLSQSWATDRLWVDNPEEIGYSIAAMTSGAQRIGLTDVEFAATVQATLERGGVRARRSDLQRDSDLLFLDIIVEPESFYASLEFRRMASYALPNGETSSEFVTVWQDYAIGVHHDDPAAIRETVELILERFVGEYNQVNVADEHLRVMSKP